MQKYSQASSNKQRIHHKNTGESHWTENCRNYNSLMANYKIIKDVSSQFLFLTTAFHLCFFITSVPLPSLKTAHVWKVFNVCPFIHLTCAHFLACQIVDLTLPDLSVWVFTVSQLQWLSLNQRFWLPAGWQWIAWLWVSFSRFKTVIIRKGSIMWPDAKIKAILV